MTIREVLARNLRVWITAARERGHPADTAAALAVRAQLMPSTVSRILHCDVAATVDTVQALADVYGREAWELLRPPAPLKARPGDGARPHH